MYSRVGLPIMTDNWSGSESKMAETFGMKTTILGKGDRKKNQYIIIINDLLLKRKT